MLSIRPISNDTRDDFFLVHNEEHGLEWCNCTAWWCPTWEEFAKRTETENRTQRDQLFERGIEDGYVLHEHDVPIGTCQVGARDRLQKLRTQYELEPDSDVWAISCFALIPSARGRGLARRFLDAILTDLRTTNVPRVQAFPVRNSEDPWTGPVALFTAAGFSCIREDRRFPVFELTLA